MANLRNSQFHIAKRPGTAVPGRFCRLLAAISVLVVSVGSSLFGQVPDGLPDFPPEEQVVEVRVTGNQTVELEKILPHIRTRAGRPYKLELIEGDVRRLNRSGMFVMVKPYTQRVDGGRVVIFEVIERPLLQEVVYVGNSKIKTKVLQKENNLKVGDALDPFAVEEGRAKIEGFYRSRGFSKVRVTIIEGDKPADRRVVYLINEGRKQRILWTKFIGNTIAGDSRLKTQIQSKPPFLYLFKGEVDRQKIDEDVNQLTAYYRSLGFFRARVGRELQFNAAENWLTLTFIIDEGPRYRVRNVSFIGNTKFATEELAENLKIQSGQFFNQSQMNHDVAEIQGKYGSVGYVFADVKADPRFLEEPGRLDLVYNISEGDRYHVGRINVEIKGDYPHTKITTALNRLSVKPGDIVDIRELRASERRLRASGLFLTDPQTGAAPKIVFSPPQLDDEIEVARKPKRREGTGGQGHGADNGRESQRNQPPPVIRGQYTSGRSVPSLRPKLPWNNNPSTATTSTTTPAGPSTNPPTQGYQPVEPQKPYGSLVNVPTPLPDQEGIFSEASPFFGGSPAGEPTRPLPLDVIAQETQTGRFMFGVGINSDAGLVGSIVIDERNFDWTRVPNSWEQIRNATAFRGAGQRFRIEAVPGTEVQRYMISFQEPYLLDTNVSLGLSGFFYDRRYYEWDEQRIGGRVSLGYQFTHDLSGTLSFRGAKININDVIDPNLPELNEVLGDNALYGFRAQMTHDTRDSAFLATEGHLVEVSFEQVVGSFTYPRAEVDMRRYFLLHERPDGSGRHVLSLSARLGVTGGGTPIYDHYYAGGFSTIRGFDFRGASPRDPATGILVGGEFQLLASTQYMFPITADDMLRAVVFCDTGTVEPTINNWRDKYRIAPGFGLRITVPAMGPAPIALDFAFPISSEQGDHEEVFSFFVGFNH